MTGHDQDEAMSGAPNRVATVTELAAEAFVQRCYGTWTPEDQAALERRLAQDPAYADAWRQVAASWDALEDHAEAPQMIAHRGEAIAVLRHGAEPRWPIGRRWPLAAAAVLALAMLGAAWQWAPWGERAGEYRTGVGERRVVDLEDRSRIVLDASTVLRVDYSAGARDVRIEEGQAQFTVAKDPIRPFKVQAGDHTVVALGTVFTVEYVERAMHVTMMEGRVAVVPRQPPGRLGAPVLGQSAVAHVGSGVLELSAGEDLRVGRDGQSVVNADVDLDAATAWLQGRIIFRDETLGEAVRRFNRYSHTRIRIDDPALAARRISGVFEAGDAAGFVSAVERYLQLDAKRIGADVIALNPRQAR